MSPSLIIFDCDGTLVNSETLNNQAILDVIRGFGIERYDMEHALTHFMGLRFSRIIAKITEETGFAFPEDAGMQYRTRVRELASLHLEPIEGIYEMVREATRFAQVCVASNGERNNVLFSLDKVGLMDFFDERHVFTGLMVDNPKPAPDLFLLAAREMGILPSRCLVIEDSIAGVRAGKAAGMAVWGVCLTHHAPKEHGALLQEAGATDVFYDAPGLHSAVAELCSTQKQSGLR